VADENENPVVPESLTRQWTFNSAFLWSIAVLAGWLAFELTAEPAVAAAVICCRFGWKDLLAAMRLRRRNADGTCGRSASWFCLASATMKIFFAASVLIAIIAEMVLFIERRRPQPDPNALMPSAIWGPLVLMVGAIPLAALLALIGVVSARIDGMRAAVRR
jgi:hypothetical protein